MDRYFSRLLLAVFAAVCSSVVVACTDHPSDREIYGRIRSADKLVLAQMTISKMATVDDIDPAKARGVKQTAAAVLDALKIGDRRAAYSYDTYLRAYIDMSRLSPSDVVIDRGARTVTVTLPPVQTEFAGRDMQIREDHYRVTGLRSEIDARERAAIKEQMNSALKAEVESDGEFSRMLAETARGRARSYFESILQSDGYSAIIRFK